MTADIETTASQPSSTCRAVTIGVAYVVLALVIDVLVGTRSPWGVKQPHVAHGVGMHANNLNDLVLFDGDNGLQIQFGADHMW